ncbi:TPA: YHS domain-containing protein [Burkholderia vietnamiensis]|uniref:YHS domain protein n=2 Tax=Burkholderia vietnamiensis TaxID=60552 RepID=A4JUW5_BURVG|nr:YHS domain-containing protein [Burkholderia vietnamiensis]ABO60068.1 YHS domain protein [Burkholderia vietnamiensis G4]HDR8956164.1 YHS domain-containing protein [Burkholderia vietnamiensis]HDR9223697.1 YHS domain-containing protein [Burkholderia vietnamiensis]
MSEGPDGALRDPVCGMSVTADSPFRSEHDGHPYFFCSASCQKKFRADCQRRIDTPHFRRSNFPQFFI